MKIHPLAAAVLALVSVSANAQSSVTLFGVVDTAIQYGSGKGTGSANRLSLVSGAYNSSRLGFRGVEDLGGGMSASFWLEAGLQSDNGAGQATNTNNQTTGGSLGGLAGGQALLFNRRSTVSLSGSWGEVRVGRDYTPEFWNLTVFDPFGTVGSGASQVANSHYNLYPGGVFGLGVRASNSIGYFLPGKLGGFYGQVMYFMGENLRNGAANEDDGSGAGVRLGFSSGPFNVALAYQNSNFASGDVKSTNLGGQWDFGVGKLMAYVSRDRVSSPSNTTGKGALIGALFPIGAGEIRVAYSQYRVDTATLDPRTRKIALGYVHNLSKRTAVYTTYARVRNSDGANVALGAAATGINQASSGFDLGVRHAF